MCECTREPLLLMRECVSLSYVSYCSCILPFSFICEHHRQSRGTCFIFSLCVIWHLFEPFCLLEFVYLSQYCVKLLYCIVKTQLLYYTKLTIKRKLIFYTETSSLYFFLIFTYRIYLPLPHRRNPLLSFLIL
jgi:hypothetical protein